jgi:hypothetical protein
LSETIERLEQLRHFSGGNPAPVILDADTDAIRSAHGVVHDDRSLRRVVFDRVGEQVDENLLQPGPIELTNCGLSNRGKVMLMPR